jgi:hypothetical protein
MELHIDAPPQDLEDLRQMLLKEGGGRIEVQEISSAGAGELREPVLLSIIVGLGGPVVVTAVVEIIKKWAEHREAMRKLELDKYRLLVEAAEKSQDLTFDQVVALAEAAHR